MKFLKNVDTRKFFGSIIGGIFFVCCILYFTYAYYEWRSSDTSINLTVVDLKTECIVGEDVNVTNIGPVLDYKDGVKTTFSLVGSNSVNVPLTLEITQIDKELQDDSFKYILVHDVNGGTDYNYDSPVASGDFSEMVVGSNLIVESLPVGTDNVYSYQFIVYIDGTIYNSPDMQNKSLVSTLLLGNCSVASSSDAEVNAPNLDDGNLIPVYYDEELEVWKKADSTNADNSWYDYNDRRWANAVMVNSSAKTTYQALDVGITVADADIVAFYVWIPRYKYRVWNITRQGGSEDSYAYDAFSSGIEIAWEKGINTTGNLLCSYNIDSGESAENLSDSCYYNDTIVSVSDSNSSYSDVWYTHPAFTFDEENLEGFWIGKFEVGGTSTSPLVLPDVVSLQEQSVSEQFTTSKIFQNFISTNMNAHMVTNMEWGALAYLTHSKYGLCNDDGCRGVYHNNSEGFFTGRSGGNIASEVLDLATMYGDSSDNSALLYNMSGYYNYKGYMLDNNGNVTTTKDITKVSSTTGNVTGVYDISGGAIEYVMANMSDSSGNFYPSNAGSSWSGSTSLDDIYYNSYSYGTSYYNIKSFNRSRLGDATAEVLGGVNNSSAWSPGVDTVGSRSMFIYYSSSRVNVWFIRGGRYNTTYASSFYFDNATGAAFTNYSFRSSLA